MCLVKKGLRVDSQEPTSAIGKMRFVALDFVINFDTASPSQNLYVTKFRYDIGRISSRNFQSHTMNLIKLKSSSD